ncbi:MAG: mechanosensitive ion channel family protein [Tenuifilaceae bacterium]|jgi:small-conductance mechanosensitive channel|nr:mechanosensitive ion channel family protein [Tenuifilaceae bacterium]
MNRIATDIRRKTIILMLCLLGLTTASGSNAYIWQQAQPTNPEGTDSTVVVVTTKGLAKEPQIDTPTEKAKTTPSLREEITHPPDVKGMISFGKIFWSIVFIFIGYFILKAISGILSLISDRKPKYQPSIRRILPMVKIAGWAFVTYIIISGIFQPPRETVFAFFASVGVAIGFASQDLLKNIFGGLMILFDKPFQIGDKIESGKYYGEVLEVGLRSTRIVTPDDSVVTIPNSEMMNQSISNANSSENNCQVVAEVYLPHTIDTKRAREIALEVAQVSKYIYLNKPITVLFFSEKTNNQPILKMRLKAYVNDVRHEFPFKSEMTELVLRELQKEGLIDDM